MKDAIEVYLKKDDINEDGFIEFKRSQERMKGEQV